MVKQFSTICTNSVN